MSYTQMLLAGAAHYDSLTPLHIHDWNIPFLSQSFELDFGDPEVFWYPAIIIITIGILNKNKNNSVPKNFWLSLKKEYSNDGHGTHI